MQEQIAQLEKRVKELENILFTMVKSDRLTFSKDIELNDGAKFRCKKFAFYGETPVVQAGAISSPDTTGASLKTAVDAIRTALINIAITA